VRVSVLGLGSAGARHARLLIELGYEVIGFDPLAAPPDGVEMTDSPEAAIARGDATIVAGPSSLHAEHALAALKLGKPTLVEKPLATTVADARSVVDAADEAGATCGVAMNLRFHPASLELKRLVDEGELGTVHFAQASFGYNLRLWHPDADYRNSYSARADLGGGIVLDAIHELDYLLWLLGPISWVSAETAHVSDLEIDVEDIAVVALRFESGALGSVDLNFFEPAYRRGCTLVGSEAVTRWDWSRETVVVQSETADERVIDVGCDLGGTYEAELADFIEAVENRGAPRTSAREGLAALCLAEAVRESALAGRRADVGSV
jgi:predicted dehydrogenase